MGNMTRPCVARHGYADAPFILYTTGRGYHVWKRFGTVFSYVSLVWADSDNDNTRSNGTTASAVVSRIYRTSGGPAGLPASLFSQSQKWADPDGELPPRVTAL